MVLSFIALAALLVLVYVLDIVIKPTSSWNNLMTCLEKGTIYALVAVSMNLLNGFTGLFSLGQAGFMLIGAYAYAVFAIAPEDRATVYQYYEGGGLIHFSLPHMLQNMMGGADAFGGA
ncbi:MAG: branched-chain amino acid ABC transporter permease, partial [Firmicutes bacterium]|nr:branched-chain amino acid ABC transporter permease [Bacillota bacterium]